MKRSLAVLTLTIGLAPGSWGQDSQKTTLPPECAKTTRVHGSFPKGPFKVLPNESYKRGPVVKYLIQEDGSVSNVTLVRSSGVADIDKQTLRAVGQWKYNSRPAGCGVIETEMTATVHWGDTH